METIPGMSLINHRPVFFEGWPATSSVEATAKDEYVGSSASIRGDHHSLKTPGTAAHTAVMKRIEEIAENPGLPDKQKRAMINDLRKQIGLSKGDMKKLYTRPLARKAEEEGNEPKRRLYASMYKAGGCVKKVFKGIGKGLTTVGKIALGAASIFLNPWSLVPMAAQAIQRIPGVSTAVNAVSKAYEKTIGFADRVVETYGEMRDRTRRWVEDTRDIFRID